MNHTKRILEKVRPSIHKHPLGEDRTGQAVKSDLRSIPALDIIRFTTSVVVMLFHLCYWRNGKVPPHSDTFNNFWWFGWVGVEIFFTLSGFVIAFSAHQASATQFAVGRVSRLFPTIWLCASITLLMTLALSPQVNMADLFISYANTLWMNPKGGHIDIVYWTLTVEISFYLMVFCLLYVGGFNLMFRTLMVVGSVSALFNIALAGIHMIQEASPAVAQALRTMDAMHTFRLLLLKHGVFFALGALLWHRLSARHMFRTQALLALLILGATLEVWHHGLSHVRQIGQKDALACLVVGVWGLGLIGIAFSNTDRVTRWIHQWLSTARVRQLGLLTFPVYLLHNIGGLLVKDSLQAHGLNGNLATLVVVILTLWAALMLSQHVEPILSRGLKQRLTQLTR